MMSRQRRTVSRAELGPPARRAAKPDPKRSHGPSYQPGFEDDEGPDEDQDEDYDGGDDDEDDDDDDYDFDEKYFPTNTYSSHSYSSRVTSPSHLPMLPKSYSVLSSRRPYSRFLFRGRHSVTRWLCWALAGAMLFFMLVLVQLSWRSGRKLQTDIGKHIPAPTPPWEKFPFLQRYYGGVRNLVSRADNIPEYPSLLEDASSNQTADLQSQHRIHMSPFNPYPDYQSEAYMSQYPPKVDCFVDAERKTRIPALQVYEGVPIGLPDPVMGNSSLFGMRDDICFDRFGRLGPYGLGYSLARGGTGAAMEGDREGADTVWKTVPEVDYRKVKWADAQERCALANANRFEEFPSVTKNLFQPLHIGKPASSKESVMDPAASTAHSDEALKLPRNAFVIRTASDESYSTETILYLRSLIAELSLHSGGEYTVHFMVHVKDDNAPIWADSDTHDQILRDSLPEEFQGMGSLWSERQMNLIYGGLAESFARDLPVHGVYRSTFMPMQHFALTHPEYDFVWNWEMDVRYTGHWYDLFDKVGKWAREQPRKGLWERNGRFYVPSEHGSWEDFRQMVRVQTQVGTSSPNNMWSGLHVGKGAASGSGADRREGDVPVWGPLRPPGYDDPFDSDPIPPTGPEAEKSTWGVGEEADLITFNPIFDPAGTTWLLAEDVTGYGNSESLPPRRAAIIAASRLSRRLLMTMHQETSLKRHTMFSEMWPASCALHHGLKAVYAPHSKYIDRRWPTAYLESTFNGGRNGATGGARTSIFGEPDHNLVRGTRGSTWYYNAGFPEVLWNRWLGRRTNNDGGEEFEMRGVGEKGGGEGRMCLPPMLLHPIKNIDMAIEGVRE